jgi:Kef-type K+ transport system membrane component KefB
MAFAAQEVPHAEQAEAEHEAGHADPFAIILLELAALILAAVFGRWAAGRLNQPSVLGELLIGVVLGNVGYWLGRPFFILVMHADRAGEIFEWTWGSGLSVVEAAQRVFSAAELAPGGVGEQLVHILTGPDAGRSILMVMAIWLFSNLGVILLLFMVGMESSVEEMLQVGPRATAVAIVGIVAPFALGLAAGMWLLPEASTPTHLFLGATLSATSVGITARVFKDLGKLQLPEAKVILGAAVIDDILGLIILAVVVGIVATGEVHVSEVAQILVLSAVFLGGMVFLGDRLVTRAISWFSRAERRHLKLLFPLTLAFLAAWLANQIGLAAIVGAFAAGLILCEGHFGEHTEQRTTAAEMIAPLEALFAPIFFVLMGMQVNLASFVEPGTLGLGHPGQGGGGACRRKWH